MVAALTYPAVLLVLALGVLVFLLVFFIPRFQLIFKGFNATLPLLTQIIIDASDAVRNYGLFIVVALALGVYSLRSWLKSARGRRAWEGFVLRVPPHRPGAGGVSRWRASAACSARCSPRACR